MQENSLITNKHILVYIAEQLTSLSASYKQELEYITQNFCGKILHSFPKETESDAIIYLCGNIKLNFEQLPAMHSNRIFVIRELSHNFDELTADYNIIHIGSVPINIYNVGVYFRHFFDNQPNIESDYFTKIDTEHNFQMLTESNKSSSAFRTGIYLTPVEEQLDGSLNFHLLRCSTNLSGPSDNFRQTDIEITTKVNEISDYFFTKKVKYNHILAQKYNNHTVCDDNGVVSEKKAKIKRHSDKTKDMPRNALMAFCTFYKFDTNKHTVVADDMFDYRYKNQSVLTRIRFQLKKKDTYKNLQEDFYLTLYPNSVLIIPLSTNRLYTHEIVPSILPINLLPTRMGYVIRCSNTEAVYTNNQTYIKNGTDCVKLEQPTNSGIEQLKELYYLENTDDEIITYDNKFNFSLNEGDYKKPLK